MVLTRGEALKQPILAPDVELELIRAWKENQDEKALEAISRAYARLCYRIATQYTNDPSRLEDLAQEGFFGIKKAIEKFKPEMSSKFSTYSRLWIQNYIAMAASTVLNDITVPARVYLDAKMGRLHPGQNDKAILASSPFVNLDASVSVDNPVSVMDSYISEENTPETLYMEANLNEKIKDFIHLAIKSLSNREADIIVRRKLKETPDTLEDIASDYGVTRERIRQIETDVMHKLKDILLEKQFKRSDFFES